MWSIGCFPEMKGRKKEKKKKRKCFLTMHYRCGLCALRHNFGQRTVNAININVFQQVQCIEPSTGRYSTGTLIRYGSTAADDIKSEPKVSNEMRPN